MSNTNEQEYSWVDRKRIIFGLPWTFTKYLLSEDKLLIRKGLFNLEEQEIRLYRIMDVTLKRSLWERLFGLGTIHCCSADKSTPEFDILHVKNSENVKNFLSDEIERERKIVLIAEDEVDNREVLETYLKDMGYEVDSAINGEVVLDMFMESEEGEQEE